MAILIGFSPYFNAILIHFIIKFPRYDGHIRDLEHNITVISGLTRPDMLVRKISWFATRGASGAVKVL